MLHLPLLNRIARREGGVQKMLVRSIPASLAVLSRDRRPAHAPLPLHRFLPGPPGPEADSAGAAAAEASTRDGESSRICHL